MLRFQIRYSHWHQHAYNTPRFTIRQEGNGKPHYLAEGFVLMEAADKDESLCLTVFLMNHDYVFPQKLLEAAPKRKGWSTLQSSEPPFEDDKVLTRHTDDVWRKDCSHFVSSKTGVSRLRPNSTHQGGVVANEGTRRSGRVFARATNTGGSVE
jgi:hypothetical protein